MTWTPRSVRAVLVVVGALVLVVAYWWWQGRSRPVVTVPTVAATATASPISLPSPAAEVVVHVIGRVRRPGIVTLDEGSRVADALAAAGGLKPGATSGDLNLARVLIDGEQVVVGGHHSEPGAAVGGTPTPGPLDLNTATAADLEQLPGVGPVLAERILAWREANGKFTGVDVLGEVAGIGDVLLEQLRPLVRV